MPSIDILVGTTSGNTEYLADQMQEQLQQAGIETRMHYEPDLEALLAARDSNSIWLGCIASHGAGDYGDSMLDFAEQLAHSNPTLDGLKYAVIAIGESCYDTYCAAGRDFDQRLQEAAAIPMIERLEIDMMNDDPEQLTPTWVQKLIDFLCIKDK